uniref:hypothetical protein n=2 Tax=Cupriavidus taiwanensis TaxID=164546 RepID=UPI001559605B|nr:hypothetical protein [Cupriavidus taiwanensis]
MMDLRPAHAQTHAHFTDAWRVAKEAAALMLFRGESAARAIAAAVARHVADACAGRECRGTIVDVESTWIPPGRDREVSAAAEEILAEVAVRLRESMRNAD